MSENALAGSPQSEWDIVGSGDPSIQGYATDISVNKGSIVNFKIKLDATAPGYLIDIYRLGYYQGFGARKIGTVTPTVAQISAAKSQPACLKDPSAGLVDCGNWAVAGAFDTTGMTSGIFLARPRRTDTGGASHIVFIVRDDSRKADLLFQTSDTTWQAYNMYPGVADGGSSLYCNGPLSNSGGDYSCATRSAKVSYNRPFETRDHDRGSWLFNAEYPMVRWMEANGYDMKYWSGVDTDRFGANPTIGLTSPVAPKAFLSVGHDEYWSGQQRTNVETARNAGINLAFFSGNEMFWKTRYEASIDGSNTGYRTLVSYKETFATGTARLDPNPANPWTGTWRDPRFSPPLDGGRPENAVTGQLWTVNCCSDRMVIPAAFKDLRFWRNTAVASLQPGEVYVTPQETLGYEWDEDVDNGARPTGLIRMSSTTVVEPQKLLDYGVNVGTGSATHALTLYRHNSGALVFGAGTVQWSWGLDAVHDRLPANPDRAMQQATVNLLADMGAQPQTLQLGADGTALVAAAMSSDIFAPTSTVTSPAAGASVPSGSRVTITGQANEHGGGAVSGVEVSVDGSTWHPAQMVTPTSWAFDWTAGAVGQTTTIRSRAADDSGNVESPGPGVTVTIVAGDCPCTSLWKPSASPVVPSAADSAAVEVGLKFYSDGDGFITGVRFYKGPANNSTHIGNLWTSSGSLLATAVFANETATGWQQVLFSSPVPITANTTYVVSYHTNVGGYAADGGYLATAGVDSPPLHASPTTIAGGNGVFGYGASQFPTQTFNGANYWVDVVYTPSLNDSTPPVVSKIKSTILDSSRVTISWTTDEPATSKILYGTDPDLLSSTTVIPPGTITINQASFTTQHTVALQGLAPNTTYYYRVISVDRSGNATNVAAPTFTVPGPTLRDTSSPDFAAGAAAGTYVAETVDGEVILAPTVGSEFSGTTMPAGWRASQWDAGGFASLANGTLLVDGARVGTCVQVGSDCQENSTLFPGHRLEFTATFSGDPFQHAGLGQTLEGAPWAIFSTDSTGGSLSARTLTSSAVANNVIPNSTSYLGFPHKYAIDWTTDGVKYYIDDALVMTHNIPIPGPMRPIAASDFSSFLGGNIVVDWVRMSPYPATGTFTSRVFDANTSASWHTIQWNAKTPAGTAVAISVRAGDTATPDLSWTAWQPIAAPGPLSLTSRYIQYQAVLSTSDPNVTPSLDDIIISTGHAPVATADAIVVPENGVMTLPASGLGSLTANDVDADNDPLEVVAVGPASHGTVVLNFDGSVRYTPAANYAGPDAFVYTASDGLMTSSATVSIDVRFGNIAPVANDDFYSVNEDSTLVVLAANGVLKNDTDVEHDALSAVLTSLPAHGQLTINSIGGFTYTPTLNYAGPDSFTYKAFDGTSESVPATVVINVLQVNDPPIGEVDAYTAVLNQPLVVVAPGVLVNDHDVEVEDTNPLHAQIVSQPVNGTLAFNANGSFSYTPNPDFLGIDTFSYAPVDHFDAVGNTVTVTITVAIKAVAQTVNGGGTVITGTDVTPTDPLNSAVTTPTAATVSIAQGVISGSQPPTGYTFLNQQVNITIRNPDGTELQASAANPIRLVFTIDGTLLLPGQTQDTIQIFRNGTTIPNCLGQTQITAANLDPCVTARELVNNDVRITVLTSHASRWNMGLSNAAIGDAPKAQNDGVYQVNFQTPLVIAASGVLGNDYARNGLTAVLTPGSAVNGTVDLAPSGAFRFVPGANACGAASFKYHANDGTTDSNEATVSILIDCQPQATGDAVTVLEDSGANVITVLSNDSDPDPGQTLIVTSVTAPAHGTASIALGGQAIAYAPAADYFGSDSFDYTISDGRGGTATATIAVTVTSVNDAPGFTKGANPSVNEDAAAQSIAGWATNLSAGPANESTQALDFIVSNDNAALFAAAPAVSANGTLTFTPAANANGVANVTVKVHDNGGTALGGVDTSAAQTFTITVQAVNDAPTFAKGVDQSVFGNAPAQTIANWATAISAGAANEAGQTLAFTVSNNNPALFSAQPAVSATGVLTYTPAANATGTALVSVFLKDNGGTLNGGADTSATQTFTIDVIKATTTTVLVASNTPSLFGVPITLTATVAGPAAAGIPAGTVTFRDGTTTLGSSPLASGVATYVTSTLAVGTHALTAVYVPSGPLSASTSAAFTETINPSAKLAVNFSVHAILDTTAHPKVQDLPVTGATVQVYSRYDQCTNGLLVLNVKSLWGTIYDGLDGPGGTDPGCPIVSSGSYKAVATTDALGNAMIIVPPLAAGPSSAYLVIARTDKFDYIKTASSTDPLYSEYTVQSITSTQTKSAPLAQLATFNGKLLPAKQTEFFGSYLNIVEPEYMDWTDDQEQYPFVMVAQGAWDLTTGVTPPEGFVPDQPVISASVADTTTAVQFTFTDVGSAWTETIVDQSIVHLGATTTTTSTIPMRNKKPSKARNDNVTMMIEDGPVTIAVLSNDRVGVKATSIALTSFTQPLNGVVTLGADGATLIYSPLPGTGGLDSFTYTITDDIGMTSTGTVTVKVLGTPTVNANAVTIAEGNAGTTQAVVTIALSNQSLHQVTVNYATVDGTATAGVDYVAKSGTVTIAPGDKSVQIPFDIIGDLLAEANEAFAVHLSSPVNALLTDKSDGQVKILDDDPPVISAQDLSFGEGNVAKTVLVTVKLSQTDPLPVTVNYTTTNGTAMAGDDYVAASGTLTFNPGVSTLQIPITIVGDTLGEPTEQFYVDLSGAANGVIGQARATVTITNDDNSTWTATTAADFQAGSAGAGTTVTQTADGEVTLAAAAGAEFFGSSLPAGWSTTVLSAGGTAVVANGSVRANGVSLLNGLTTVGTGRTLDFVATFTGVNQAVGLGNGSLVSPLAVFVVKADGNLYARTIAPNAKGVVNTTETLMAGVDWLNKPHQYTIAWNATSAGFKVDGTLMASHGNNQWGTLGMGLMILDSNAADVAVSVDWMRLTPYATSGTYSLVFDAGTAGAVWQKLTSTLSTVNGTTAAISYRVGETATPDASWSASAALAGSGGVLTGTGRYIQFTVQLSTSDPSKAPTLKDVTLNYRLP